MKWTYLFLLAFLLFFNPRELLGMLNNNNQHIIEKREFNGEKIRITQTQHAQTYFVTIETEVRTTIASFSLSVRIENLNARSNDIVTVGTLTNIKIQDAFLNKEFERFIASYAENFFKNHSCSFMKINIKKDNSALAGLHTWRSELGFEYQVGPVYIVFSKDLTCALEKTLLDLFI
jgi:hypothetical protein